MDEPPGPEHLTPFWLSAFLDHPAPLHEVAARFWAEVTGCPLSARRGADAEFATLVPPDGDDYLRLQRVGDPAPRIHLDVHVVDPAASAVVAEQLGARPQTDPGLGYRVMTSPGGLVFCLVSHRAARRPAPRTWPAGHRSMVYQVCLDVPQVVYDVESAFWSLFLEARVEVLAARPEFAWLRGPSQLALDVLVQRLDEVAGPVRAHLDLGTTDRAAEVRRHESLGAAILAEEDFWTTMRDPGGLPYCVTDRDPATGRLT